MSSTDLPAFCKSGARALCGTAHLLGHVHPRQALHHHDQALDLESSRRGLQLLAKAGDDARERAWLGLGLGLGLVRSRVRFRARRKVRMRAGLRMRVGG